MVADWRGCLWASPCASLSYTYSPGPVQFAVPWNVTFWSYIMYFCNLSNFSQFEYSLQVPLYCKAEMALWSLIYKWLGIISNTFNVLIDHVPFCALFVYIMWVFFNWWGWPACCLLGIRNMLYMCVCGILRLCYEFCYGLYTFQKLAKPWSGNKQPCIENSPMVL